MKNEIGTIVSLTSEEHLFKALVDLNLHVCQLVSWSAELWTDIHAERLKEEAVRNNVRITGFWAGWPGPCVWNLTEGPITLGLVPASYRELRTETLKLAGTFAQKLGTPAVITHLGFIPENPLDPDFQDLVVTVSHIAQYLNDLGLQFWLETGQETPVTMLRLIHYVNAPNIGINLDPANLILYGRVIQLTHLMYSGIMCATFMPKMACIQPIQ